MTYKHFFVCTYCDNVIIENPERLYEQAKNCPACLQPGVAESSEPFERVEVTDD